MDALATAKGEFADREACSGFGKIVTKMRHAFSSSCYLAEISRCSIPTTADSFLRGHRWRV